MFRIGVSRDSLNISCVFWLHNVLRSMFSDVSIYEHGRWLGCWGSQIVAEGVKFKLQVGLQNVDAKGLCYLENGEGATSGNHAVICATTPELDVHAGRLLWLWSWDMAEVLGYLHNRYPMWRGTSRLLVNHHRGSRG